MSDKFKGLSVLFEEPLSEYKTKQITQIILMIREVASVSNVETQTIHDHLNRQRVRNEFFKKIVEVMEDNI